MQMLVNELGTARKNRIRRRYMEEGAIREDFYAQRAGRAHGGRQEGSGGSEGR